MMFRLATILSFITLTACSNYKPHEYETYEVPTDIIGMVVSATGFPSLQRHNQPYILAEQSKFYTGDVVTTDEQSLVHVRLNSGTELQLGTDSHLLIMDFRWREPGYEIDVGLKEGSLLITNNQIDRHVTINTIMGTITTDAESTWLRYAGPNQLSVVSLDNKEVTIRNDDGLVVLNKRLEASSIAAGAAPRPPQLWSQSRFDEALKQSRRIRR